MGDLIDRKALMDELEITMKCDDCQYRDTIRKGYCTMPSEFFNACVAITDAPTVEKKGKWIIDTDDSELINCSCCRRSRWSREPFELMVRGFKFCPECGAKMEETK